MQFSFERDQQDASSASMSFVLRSQEIFRVGVCFGVNLPGRKFYLYHTRILMFEQPPPVQNNDMSIQVFSRPTRQIQYRTSHIQLIPQSSSRHPLSLDILISQLALLSMIALLLRNHLTREISWRN